MANSPDGTHFLEQRVVERVFGFGTRLHPSQRELAWYAYEEIRRKLLGLNIFRSAHASLGGFSFSSICLDYPSQLKDILFLVKGVVIQ